MTPALLKFLDKISPESHNVEDLGVLTKQDRRRLWGAEMWYLVLSKLCKDAKISDRHTQHHADDPILGVQLINLLDLVVIHDLSLPEALGNPPTAI